MSHAVVANAPAPKEGCTETPIIRERGQREVFCGLTGIIWLHRKIQDAFFLIVGSRTCAHLMQSAAGVMIFAEPRFATAIIDERDLAGMADVNEELDRVARLLERRPDIKTLFLVGSCPSEVIKLDLSKAAERLSKNYAPDVRILNYSGSGIETTFTRAKTAASPRWCRKCQRQATARIGEAADCRLPRRCNRGPVHPTVRRAGPARTALPADAQKRSNELPPVGPNTRYLLAQPFSSTRRVCWRTAARKRIPAPFPLGVEGHHRLAQGRGRHLGCRQHTFDEVTAPARARAERALEHYREQLAGRGSSSSPIRSLRCRLRASCRARWIWS